MPRRRAASRHGGGKTGGGGPSRLRGVVARGIGIRGRRSRPAGGLGYVTTVHEGLLVTVCGTGPAPSDKSWETGRTRSEQIAETPPGAPSAGWSEEGFPHVRRGHDGTQDTSSAVTRVGDGRRRDGEAWVSCSGRPCRRSPPRSAPRRPSSASAAGCCPTTSPPCRTTRDGRRSVGSTVDEAEGAEDGRGAAVQEQPAVASTGARRRRHGRGQAMAAGHEELLSMLAGAGEPSSFVSAPGRDRLQVGLPLGRFGSSRLAVGQPVVEQLGDGGVVLRWRCRPGPAGGRWSRGCRPRRQAGDRPIDPRSRRGTRRHNDLAPSVLGALPAVAAAAGAAPWCRPRSWVPLRRQRASEDESGGGGGHRRFATLMVAVSTP